jgi:hypothetical protein
MAVLPAQVQSVSYGYPVQEPNPFLSVVNAGLQGYFNRQQQKKDEIAKAFPILAQMRMIQPTGDTVVRGKAAPGTFSYGGINWKPSTTGAMGFGGGIPGVYDWSDYNSYLNSQGKLGQLPVTDKEATSDAIWFIGQSDPGFLMDPKIKDEEKVQQIAKIAELFKSKGVPAVPGVNNAPNVPNAPGVNPSLSIKKGSLRKGTLKDGRPGVYVTNPKGQAVMIPEADLDEALKTGYTL